MVAESSDKNLEEHQERDGTVAKHFNAEDDAPKVPSQAEDHISSRSSGRKAMSDHGDIEGPATQSTPNNQASRHAAEYYSSSPSLQRLQHHVELGHVNVRSQGRREGASIPVAAVQPSSAAPTLVDAGRTSTPEDEVDWSDGTLDTGVSPHAINLATGSENIHLPKLDQLKSAIDYWPSTQRQSVTFSPSVENRDNNATNRTGQHATNTERAQENDFHTSTIKDVVPVSDNLTSQDTTSHSSPYQGAVQNITSQSAAIRYPEYHDADPSGQGAPEQAVGSVEQVYADWEPTLGQDEDDWQPTLAMDEDEIILPITEHQRRVEVAAKIPSREDSLDRALRLIYVDGSAMAVSAPDLTGDSLPLIAENSAGDVHGSVRVLPDHIEDRATMLPNASSVVQDHQDRSADHSNTMDSEDAIALPHTIHRTALYVRVPVKGRSNAGNDMGDTRSANADDHIDALESEDTVMPARAIRRTALHVRVPVRAKPDFGNKQQDVEPVSVNADIFCPSTHDDLEMIDAAPAFFVDLTPTPFPRPAPEPNGRGCLPTHMHPAVSGASNEQRRIQNKHSRTCRFHISAPPAGQQCDCVNHANIAVPANLNAFRPDKSPLPPLLAVPTTGQGKNKRKKGKKEKKLLRRIARRQAEWKNAAEQDEVVGVNMRITRQVVALGEQIVSGAMKRMDRDAINR